MFNLKDFVMKTIKNMIGNIPDYKVQEYALSWYNRGTITEDDLAEIDVLVSTQNTIEETPPIAENDNAYEETDETTNINLEGVIANEEEVSQ